jgi:hypothetical protein
VRGHKTDSAPAAAGRAMGRGTGFGIMMLLSQRLLNPPGRPAPAGRQGGVPGPAKTKPKRTQNEPKFGIPQWAGKWLRFCLLWLSHGKKIGFVSSKIGGPNMQPFPVWCRMRGGPLGARSRAFHGVRPFYEHSPYNMALSRLYHRFGINFVGHQTKAGTHPDAAGWATGPQYRYPTLQRGEMQRPTPHSTNPKLVVLSHRFASQKPRCFSGMA